MDAHARQLLQKLLKDHGYSITLPRRMLAELLWEQEPQSMHQLLVRSRGQIDRASLYRTVALFERLGIVQRMYLGWKYKIELSDIFSHHHHHISCLGCGKLVAITEDAAIEQLIAQLAASHGYTADNHQLEIRGYCTDCQQ